MGAAEVGLCKWRLARLQIVHNADKFSITVNCFIASNM